MSFIENKIAKMWVLDNCWLCSGLTDERIGDFCIMLKAYQKVLVRDELSRAKYLFQIEVSQVG